MAVCQNPRYPCSSHQNSWDLWMFIPLKMVLIGIDPYLYDMGVSLKMLCTPLYPMVLLIMKSRSEKWLAIIGNIPNIFRQSHMSKRTKIVCVLPRKFGSFTMFYDVYGYEDLGMLTIVILRNIQLNINPYFFDKIPRTS